MAPSGTKSSLTAKLVRASIALTAFGVFAGLIWYAYSEGIREGSERVAPLIRADKGPLKTRPSEPGGLRVPHQDKRIYDRIEPKKKGKRGTVERLIPRPGQVGIAPQAKPEAERRIRGGPARGAASIDRAKKKRSSVSKRRQMAKRPTPKKRELGPDPLGIRIQIAAFPSPQAAARRWERLMGRHRDLIGKLDWFVEKVNRGRGLRPLYRLQLGPLQNRKAADELCTQLGRRKVSCLFVKG